MSQDPVQIPSVAPPVATSINNGINSDIARTSPATVRSRALRKAGLFILIAVVLAAAVWWLNANRIDRTEREFARRIQDSDAVAKESRTFAKQAQDQVIALQSRLAVLESKQAESQSQQLALEQLYQDLSRTRDDWALAEVEQIISVAAQQLQLAGNVQGAIIGLQNADNRLARADKPQFINIRRIIQRDLERLNALPNVDLAGNALRLDSLVSMVDGLPLLAGEKPAPRPRLDAQIQPGKINAKPAAVREPDWGERLSDALRHAAAEVWQEFQQLVQVRQVTQPDALLLAPDQMYFARENLKLRLLNARLALLARQETTYRADLLRAQETLQQYFDTRSRQTIAALALMKQIQSSNTVVELPTLSESLTAVRSFKAPRER